MEFVCVAVTAICLLSAAQSAPVSVCDSLLERLPIRGREEILGKWVHIGESTNLPGSAEMTKMLVDSVWLNLTAAEQEDGIIFSQIQKSFGICSHVTSNYTIRDNAFHLEYPIKVTAVMIRTSCPDCLVSYSNFTLGENEYHSLQLVSRRTEVSAEEKREFQKQVECLNLPQVTFLDSKKELCPDPFTSPNSKSIDVANTLRNFDFSQLVKILTSSKAVEKLTDLVSSQLPADRKVLQS
ncbi:hypothetical protein OJAV_G00007710 [Oryzias javanicus]|uniref:Apolipoprotein M n=1 Tax=Oryzias javanicus TaxID=123683 RepID=A0A437DN24_ORYJA|nr:hypothetical protein OJAV_G00007710 [Oryzias javanicus]